MPEKEELINLIVRREKLVAMLAPSFPAVFGPQIIGMLKRLGFRYVVEVARGAEETNKQLLALLKLHPGRRYITNPCPTVMRIIRSKYPQLMHYLSPIDSPMIATAKIVAKKYPGVKKVFIGPCLMKKFEAADEHKELNILAVTYKDLQDIFDIRKIKPTFFDRFSSFDISATKTRLYPISGGLSQSSGVIKNLTDEEYDVISGSARVEKALQEFLHKPELKILDILNCEGGCINGPGIVSPDSLETRRQKVINYWEK